MSAKNARNEFNKMSAGPTPYMDTKGRRIRLSGRGALYTENSKGNRAYNPTAAFIKPVSGNGNRVNINNKNVMTVPKNIRPFTFNNSNNNNNNSLVHCRACGKTYDGFAQCCFEMNHVRVPKRN